jgi:hypothetical protein
MNVANLKSCSTVQSLSWGTSSTASCLRIVQVGLAVAVRLGDNAAVRRLDIDETILTRIWNEGSEGEVQCFMKHGIELVLSPEVHC